MFACLDHVLGRERERGAVLLHPLTVMVQEWSRSCAPPLPQCRPNLTRPFAGLDYVPIPRAPVGHHSHWGLDKLPCDLSTLDVHEVRTLDVDEKPDAAY